jgi:DNA-binding MarR family transcriptional regulator
MRPKGPQGSHYVPPTPQQLRVLAFCRARVSATGYFPTSKEIAEHMGWKHANSVPQALHRLEKHGLVVIEAMRSDGRVLRWNLAPGKAFA